MTSTGLTNWDIALPEISGLWNHSWHGAIKMKPYELQFNAQSHFDSSSWIPFHRRKAARLEIEGQNDEETPGDIILQARDEAIA
jgi:hypothetical protein